MRIRSIIKRYFGFSKSETNAFLILLPLMFLVLISEPVYRNYFAPGLSPIEIITLHGAKPGEHEILTEDKSELISSPKVHFGFDPNRVSFDSLVLWGVSERLARQLVNFRSKGGKFYQKSDLLKLYGMTQDLYAEMDPWLKISSPKHEYLQTFKKRETPEISTRFDLNTVDTTQLVEVKGIGPVLAKRIVRYRESLGGFISKEQLNQVYGLDSLTVSRIWESAYLTENFVPARMNINLVDEMQLSTHPYISKAEAKIIVMYRMQHGNFMSVSDLKKIHGLKEGTFNKILPYLTVD